jgi:2-hydroxychromene-2-carboxylate isomerase
MAHIDYYVFIDSPFTYLGGQRFLDLVNRQKVDVCTKPTRYRDIFAATGGALPENRAPQRRAYRMMELRRWRTELGVPMIFEPTVFPAQEILGNRLVIAAQLAGKDTVRLVLEIGRSLWQDDQNIDEEDVLHAAGLDADAIRRDGPNDDALDAIVTENTNEAISRGVFGAPSYVFDGGEIMWGQDRLHFVAKKLAALEKSGA